MRSLLITSTRTAAGKTTVGLGLALNSTVKCGFCKPFGDQMVYRKKSLVDLDTMVFCEWLGLDKRTESSCLGFDPEKIASEWNREGLDKALLERLEINGQDKDLVLIETGRNYSYGGMMGMDSITLAKKFGSSMLLVAEGNADLIVDKVLAISRCLENNAELKGVVINKCDEKDRAEIEENVLPALEKLGIRVLGILPREELLERARVELILDKLNAKLVAGENGLEKLIGKVMVGALGADQALKMSEFHQRNKLLITGGDRVDLIYASLADETSGIVLTNNVLPHPKIMAKADELDIPILSVPMDTYTTAKAVYRINAEISPEDEDKKDLIKNMIAKNLDVKSILG